MRLLLTGASGFIGSQVARLAAAEGHEVLALVRPGTRERLGEVREALRVLEGDLGNLAPIERQLGRTVPDACLHLAWYTAAEGRYFWAPENVTCLTGSLGLVRLLRDLGCHHHVLAGTSNEYAPSQEAVSESSPLAPATLYAAAKQSLSLTATLLGREDEWRVSTARIFSVYGPRQDPRRLVPFVISKLLAAEPCDLTCGEQVRDYLHVADVAGALLAVVRSRAAGPVNIGSSQGVSVATIAEHIGKLIGRPDLVRLGRRSPVAGEPPFLVANTDRLRDEIGWRPGFELASGLSDTVEWWRSLREV